MIRKSSVDYGKKVKTSLTDSERRVKIEESCLVMEDVVVRCMEGLVWWEILIFIITKREWKDKKGSRMRQDIKVSSNKSNE